MTALLDVRGLSVAYPDGLVAVRDVSFQLEPGRALGIVGESGSGKSTIAGAILDLLGPGAEIAGSIRFEGMELRALPPGQRRRLLGRRIGSVFQDPFTSLNPAIQVGRQIAEPLEQHFRLSRRAAFERACELLADMRVDRPREVAAAWPHQLSGGMQQRALIAAAIACEPPLLVLDEPTTALDVTVEAQILALLAELRARMSMSVLLISHNIGVVRRICDDVAVLYASQIVEHGPAGQVLDRPAHPYTKGLMASRPKLRAGTRATRLPSIGGRIADLRAPPPGCFFTPRCPFAEARCESAAPAPAAADDRTVRCWKWQVVGEWPDSAPAATASVAGDRTLLRVENVAKRYGRRRRQVIAVDDVSFAIDAGEVVGLVGESGSGKSTLGRLVLRLAETGSGRIRFDETEIASLRGTDLRTFRGRAQIVFQNANASLNPRLSIGAALERPLVLFGHGDTVRDTAARRRRVAELLEMVRLPAEYAGRFPHQLSGGEKQRVAIARALATGPAFIVCDEPVSALDLSVQAAIVNLLADLRDAFGLTYLFISHDLAVVAQLCDRIAVMHRGRICEIGTAAEILHAPRHPYTQSLLASAATT